MQMLHLIERRLVKQKQVTLYELYGRRKRFPETMLMRIVPRLLLYVLFGDRLHMPYELEVSQSVLLIIKYLLFALTEPRPQMIDASYMPQ